MSTPAAGLAAVESEAILLNGQGLTGDLTGAVTDIELTRTTDGASTVVVSLTDPFRTILNSPLLAQASTLTLDGLSFTLVAVSKQQDLISATFESTSVNQLRKNTSLTPAAGPGTTTRYQYAQRLLAGTGIVINVPSDGVPTQSTLAQGTSSDPSEDKWTCLTRLASDVQDRCFESGGQIWFGPDSWLMQGPAPLLSEHVEGTDNIDFDFDTGQPLQTATITVVAATWAFAPGSPVGLHLMGPATGTYLVTQVTKSLYTATATVTASAPQAQLPEPTGT